MKLRGAISGFGNVASLGHLPGWRTRLNVEIVAVHDPVAARRHEALRLIRGVRVYEDLDLMLSGERLDFIDICSPPAYHVDAAEKALQANVHTLVEKPLCLTVADFDRLAALARKQNRALSCVHNWKYAPVYKKAAELIASGETGPLRYLSLSRLRDTHAGGAAWRLDPKIGGGGILVDHGWHVFYLMHSLSGGLEPESISARLHVEADSPVETAADLTINFRGGLLAYAHLSWRAPIRRNSAILYGDKGLLEIENDKATLTDASGRVLDCSVRDAPDDSYHAAWFSEVAANFEHAIAADAESQIRSATLAEARVALALTLAARRSNDLGSVPVAP
jgi:predicted dehydrogenase